MRAIWNDKNVRWSLLMLAAVILASTVYAARWPWLAVIVVGGMTILFALTVARARSERRSQ